MTPDLNHRVAAALARLVELGRIKSAWVPGMRDADTKAQVVDRFPLWWSPSLECPVAAVDDGCVWLADHPAVMSGPDLSDPLTVQALVLLLGDALPGWCWLAPSFDPRVGQWAVWHWTGEGDPIILGHGMLPQHAVVMALEAATAPRDGRDAQEVT